MRKSDAYRRGENAIFLIKHNTDYVYNLKILLIIVVSEGNKVLIYEKFIIL